MHIRGLIFDVNGTLIHIKTDEGKEEIYRAISHFLLYQGISIHRNEVRDLYFRIMEKQRRESGEEHPEFDAVAIFREIIGSHRSGFTTTLPNKKLESMPLFLAEMYRAISLERLELYPGVKEALEELKLKYLLAAVSDAQTAYAVPEMKAVGLLEYFNPVIVSGDYGYRKPDTRLFQKALEAMRLNAGEVIFVGNDAHRDVYGAKRAGMKVILFMSDQGEKEYRGVKPDCTIDNFYEVIEAVRYFEKISDRKAQS